MASSSPLELEASAELPQAPHRTLGDIMETTIRRALTDRELVAEARAFVLDCVSADELDYAASLPDVEILRWTQRRYVGGLRQLRADIS